MTTQHPAAAPPAGRGCPRRCCCCTSETRDRPGDRHDGAGPLGNLKAAAERIYASVREAANHLSADGAGWEWDKPTS